MTLCVGSVDLVINSDLDLGNGLSGVEVLGAGVGAVHNGVALVELEGVVQSSQTLLALGVTRIGNPAVGLHEHSRAQVLVAIPPVGGARSRTAGAQNALVHAVEFAAVLLALQVLALLVGLRGGVSLEPGLDGLVLHVEGSKVGHQVTNNLHMGQGVDGRGLGVSLVDLAQTGQRVGAIDVHGARAANTLTARTAESESLVLLVLDLDEGIENHGTTRVHVDLVSLNARLSVLLRIIAIDFKVLNVDG